MNTMRTFTAAIAVLSVSGLAQAHHSFAANGDRMQRWLVLGPPIDELRLRAAALYLPESGDVIGFCATPFKDARILEADEAVTEAVRGYAMLRPDGQQQVWDPRGRLCQ